MEIVPVLKAEKAELWAHLQAYLRELRTERDDRDEPYPHFEPYWREPDARWPFWGVTNSRRIGFALVRSTGERLEMAEFCIFPTDRRAGIGSAFARGVIERFPGEWEVSASTENTTGVAFWRHALSGFVPEESPAAGASRVQWRFVVHRPRNLPMAPLTSLE